MIRDWRQKFGTNFLFMNIQLAGFDPTNKFDFRPMRWTQEQLIKKIPFSGMASIVDLGHPTDIHPGFKDEVGLRVERIGSAMLYQNKIEYRGPKLTSATQELNGGQILFTLKFDQHAGSQGLKLRPRTYCSTCCNNLSGIFDIVDQNNKVYEVPLFKLSDNAVQFTMTNPGVKIIAVRSWQNYAQCVISSVAHNLPVTPFVSAV